MTKNSCKTAHHYSLQEFFTLILFFLGGRNVAGGFGTNQRVSGNPAPPVQDLRRSPHPGNVPLWPFR